MRNTLKLAQMIYIFILYSISGDLFGNLALTLSDQLPFQNVSEFGLRI
jgi:hypothetical protein